MTAEEIRETWPKPWSQTSDDDQIAVEFTKLDVLVEIAAQLAELNQRLRKGGIA